MIVQRCAVRLVRTIGAAALTMTLAVSAGVLAPVVLAPTAQAAAATAGPAVALATTPRLASLAAAPRLVSFDQQMVVLINRARVASRLPALIESRGLTSVALWWSSRLSAGATGYQLAHNPNAWTMVASNGAANRTSWGENVAWSSSTGSTAAQIFSAYMNSPGHRANILAPSYRFVGMGTVAAGHGLWNTTEFTDKVQPGQAVVVSPPTAMSSAKARALISGWYIDVLGRSVDPGALSARGSALMHGARITDQVRQIVQSAEGLNRLVGTYYQTYLHRPADASGVASHAAQLRAGAAPGAVIAGLLGSHEAFVRAGSTNAAWVRYAFAAALGRGASAADVAHWSAAVVRWGMASVANSVANSTEGIDRRINGFYQRFLKVNGSPAGIIGWVAKLRATGELNVQIGFLTSTAYSAKHN